MAVGTKDETILKRIRTEYRYLSNKWRKSQEERKIDLRYCCGDPWSSKDRKAREDADRPCLNHDEIRAYLNQAINSVRQNKRGIKIDPEGQDADAKEAELRQDLIRTIEYKHNGSQIYITSGFENAIRGGYGFFRIGRQYVGKTFDQEITIKPILNPDTVLFDWDCKEADWSDGRKCFVLDHILKEDFKRRFPNAEVKDFTGEHREIARDWIKDDKILIAEYWEIESEYTTLYLMEDGTVLDQLPRGYKPIATREYEEKTLIQRLTNGVEILEEIPQPGEILPIIPVIGEQIWIDEGGGAERILISLPRLARDPQMSLAYLVSQEAEEAKLTPKVPFIGYKGQFDSAREAWENVTSIPYAFLEVDVVIDGATGTILAKPERTQFVPNFGAYEIAKDACRRAVQAAMGISPLPTAAQRNNEKSGIALERIAQQQAVGSFHFVDNFDQAIRLAGRVMNSWISPVYDTQRKMHLRRANEETYPAVINTETPYIDEKNQEKHYKLTESEQQVTVSTGPSFQSQQEEVTDFLNNMMANLPKLPLDPKQQQDILARVIRMKNMGPQGDELADLVSPPKPEGQAQIPPEIMQQVQQMQQQLQAMNEYAQQKEKEVQELRQKLESQMISNEYKLEIERMRQEVELAKAEIARQSQGLTDRMQFVENAWNLLQTHAHERGMQAEELAAQPAETQEQL